MDQARGRRDGLRRPLDDALIRSFVTLPDRLGPTRPTDAATERALLTGSHPLSPGLTIIPFVVERRGEVVGRCALSWRTDVDSPGAGAGLDPASPRGDTGPRGAPPADPQTTAGQTKPGAARPAPDAAPRTAQLGFFDCVNDPTVAGELFARAADAAREFGRTELIGPVDASFWLHYRQKIDHFSDPYVGEPTNPPYYPHLWADAGWEVAHRYVSVMNMAPPADFHDPILERRLARAVQRGYRLAPLDLRQWDVVFPQIHELFTRLYARLPLFHGLSLDAFTTVFGSLRRVVHPDLITLAWRDDELAGFFIALPDFGDLTLRRLTPANLAKILWRKGHFERIVAAYLGVTEPGLGPALSARLVEQARQRGVGIVSSLINEGVPTSAYAPGLALDQRHYVLWRQALTT